MRQPTLSLSVPLPSLSTGEYYQLLHVGPRTYSSSGDYTITAYFQPWQGLPLLASASMPVARQIAIQRTEALYPGSLWNSKGVSQVRPASSPLDWRAWYSGAQPLKVMRLREALDLASLPMAAFWASQGDTWVAIVDQGIEQIIIPCFELLRALYYHAGARIIQYCFSQLPWSLLCHPHLAPTPATGHKAQMYVAATRLTDSEARILGGLLFDSLLLRTLNQAQTHWVNADSSSQPVYAKTAGQLGHNVLWRGEGQAFAYKDGTCFWVASLHPITSPYSFRWLLYHGLESNTFPSHEPPDFPTCSDVLNYGSYKAPSIRLESTGIVTFSVRPWVGPHATKQSLMATPQILSPGVARGPAWAREVSAFPIVWLNNLPAPPSKVLSIRTTEEIGSSADVTLFAHLLHSFTSTGHMVRMLTINNEEGYFGPEVSVFPQQGFAPLPGLSYRHRVRVFQLAQINFCEGFFFLLRFHHLPGVVLLCQKQNLGAPSNTEWTQLLHILGSTHSLADIKALRDRCKQLYQYALEPMAALLVRAVPLDAVSFTICRKFAEHTLTCFRRQLALQVGLLLQYPDGFSTAHKQRVRQVLARQKMFRSPTTEWDRAVNILWSFYYPPTGRNYNNREEYNATIAQLNT